MSTELFEHKLMKSSNGQLNFEISLFDRNRRLGHKYHIFCAKCIFLTK